MCVGGGGGGGVPSSACSGVHFTVNGPGHKEASSGGVGTRVNYGSIFPADGVGNLG